MKRFIIIDAQALIHRAFHALPLLTDKKARPTNAIYGFTSVFLKMVSELKPDYLVAAFDLPEPTFRHKEFAAYKATRPKTPEDLEIQIPRIKEVLRAFNVPILERPGFEADDIIGSLIPKIKSAQKKDKLEILIVTGDLDTLQLVEPGVKVYTFKKGISQTIIYDEQAVKERFGFEPEKLPDFKGLKGDPSDNIPGVKGIGEKGPTALIQKFGSLEKLYQNLEKADLPQKTKTLLLQGKTQALFSKELATIRKDVPFKFSLKKACWQEYSPQKVVSLLEELGFQSLIKRLPLQETRAKRQETRLKVDYKKVQTKAEVQKLVQDLTQQKILALAFDKKGLCLGWGLKDIFYLPALKENFKKIKKILENSEIQKIGFDLKRIYKDLRRQGIDLKGLGFDALLAYWLVQPDKKNYDLEKLVSKELCFKTKPYFSVRQVALVLASQEKLQTLLRKNRLEQLLKKIEMPLVPVLAKMEENGIRLNPQKLQQLNTKITKRLQKLSRKIWSLAGREFNINSPKQLSEVLFSRLQLPTAHIRCTPTGAFSTDEAELRKLKILHPIIPLILKFRELTKLKTTYIEALPKFIGPNGRIHTTFSQIGTVTGRLSSFEPNLQNIPVKGKWGKKIREAFEAEPGFSLLSFDFSQIELRIVAHIARDKNMLSAFEKGEDIHILTACRLFGVKKQKVTTEMRQAAKTLNFGIIYGLSPFGFSQASGFSRAQAQEFITEYFKNFPQIAQYIRDIKEKARKQGFVTSLFGRRRLLPASCSGAYQARTSAEREAVNFPIQATAADIIKMAMVRIDKEILQDAGCRFQGTRCRRQVAGKNKELFDSRDRPDCLQPDTCNRQPAACRLLLQIHDELIFEVRDDQVTTLAPKIKKIMESVAPIKPELKVEVSLGKNWGELK